jgi:uncharacterized membrane protein (UPF0127 family)
VALATAGGGSPAAVAASLPQGALAIRTRDGRLVRVGVDVASTPALRAAGLAGRRVLARDRGMLFVFPTRGRTAFWMRATTVPLSIAFIDDRGRIAGMLDMAPCRRDPCRQYRPRAPYRTALEVGRGAFRRWGVSTGDRVWARIGGALRRPQALG